LGNVENASIAGPPRRRDDAPSFEIAERQRDRAGACFEARLKIRRRERMIGKVEYRPDLTEYFAEPPEFDYLAYQLDNGQFRGPVFGFNCFQNNLKVPKVTTPTQGLPRPFCNSPAARMSRLPAEVSDARECAPARFTLRLRHHRPRGIPHTTTVGVGCWPLVCDHQPEPLVFHSRQLMLAVLLARTGVPDAWNEPARIKGRPVSCAEVCDHRDLAELSSPTCRNDGQMPRSMPIRRASASSSSTVPNVSAVEDEAGYQTAEDVPRARRRAEFHLRRQGAGTDAIRG